MCNFLALYIFLLIHFSTPLVFSSMSKCKAFLKGNIIFFIIFIGVHEYSLEWSLNFPNRFGLFQIRILTHFEHCVSHNILVWGRKSTLPSTRYSLLYFSRGLATFFLFGVRCFAAVADIGGYIYTPEVRFFLHRYTHFLFYSQLYFPSQLGAANGFWEKEAKSCIVHKLLTFVFCLLGFTGYSGIRLFW